LTMSENNSIFSDTLGTKAKLLCGRQATECEFWLQGFMVWFRAASTASLGQISLMFPRL
jgi:hypothetical protein